MATFISAIPLGAKEARVQHGQWAHCSLRRSSLLFSRRKTPHASLSASEQQDAFSHETLMQSEYSSEMEFDSEGESSIDLDLIEDGVVDVLGADYDLVEKTKKVRSRTQSLVHQIDVPPESTLTSDADELPPIEQDETAPWARTVVRAADERKAKDPVAIRVMRLTYITSFLVIVTGKSTPQLRAIANLVEEKMYTEHGEEPKRTSGTPTSGWLLLDYGDMMVNIFSPEQRAKYNLEGLWKAGEILDISDCITTGDEEDEDVDETEESLDDWLS